MALSLALEVAWSPVLNLLVLSVASVDVNVEEVWRAELVR